MSRFRQIFVDKDGGRRVTHCREGPQLLELAAELRNDLRWISVGGRYCHKLAWNAQWFSVEEVGQGRLLVTFKGRSHAEDERKRVGQTFLCSAHYGSIDILIHTIHKTISGRMESRFWDRWMLHKLARTWNS